MNVGIIILAAGGSERMGEPKQLLEVNGMTLIRRITEVAMATTCFPIVVVLGANKEKIKLELGGMPITIIENPTWQEGIASSIKIGLAGLYLTQKEVEAVIFTTADMPFVEEEILNKLIEVADDFLIVASRYDNQLGVPALFKREFFNELLELSGDEGAKKIIKKHSEKVGFIEFPKGSIDLDTPEDYQQFIR